MGIPKLWIELNKISVERDISYYVRLLFIFDFKYALITYFIETQKDCNRLQLPNLPIKS